MKKYLLDRLREPSTWAGLFTILTLAGVPVSPTTWGLTQQVVGGAVGLWAVLSKEGAPA